MVLRHIHYLMNSTNVNESFVSKDGHSDTQRPSALEVWGFGFLAVTVINSCAAVGIAIMPLLGRKSFHYLLTILIGLGVGSLSGSALFHLIPEAFHLSHNSNPSHIWYCWTSVAGVYFFFLIDKFLKMITKYRKQRKTKPRPRVSVSIVKISTSNMCQTENEDCCKIEHPSMDYQNSNIDDVSNNNSFTTNASEAVIWNHNEEKTENIRKDVAPVAWMVIFGDAIHNFVDGLSIGAAFSRGVISGIGVCVAVICEEFPHEFGDIAILVSSGMSTKEALSFNLLSALTCYFGFILGVIMSELQAITFYVFALAAGMFLYVALANMVPEMNATMEKAMDESMEKGFLVLILQCSGITIGLLSMFLLAFYESFISFK